MSAAGKLVAVAAGEVGVRESPAGSNRVKYNTWFYGREVSGSSYPWCCAFVCWCFAQAGLAGLVRRTGGCTTMMNWFKARGRLVEPKQARPGDLVFYQFDQDAYADHIGIVERVSESGLTAIEGNTSVTSQDNGGAVMRRTRRWSVVMAVARPDYDSVKEECEMTKEEVRRMVAETVADAIQPKVYNTVDECPEWARKAVSWAVERGCIQGDEHGRLGLDNTKLWAIQVTYNIMERGKG